MSLAARPATGRPSSADLDKPMPPPRPHAEEASVRCRQSRRLVHHAKKRVSVPAYNRNTARARQKDGLAARLSSTRRTARPICEGGGRSKAWGVSLGLAACWTGRSSGPGGFAPIDRTRRCRMRGSSNCRTIRRPQRPQSVPNNQGPRCGPIRTTLHILYIDKDLLVPIWGKSANRQQSF